MDEFILGGEAQETSKKIVLKAIEQADMLQEVGKDSCWRKMHYMGKCMWTLDHDTHMNILFQRHGINMELL